MKSMSRLCSLFECVTPTEDSTGYQHVGKYWGWVAGGTSVSAQCTVGWVDDGHHHNSHDQLLSGVRYWMGMVSHESVTFTNS